MVVSLVSEMERWAARAHGFVQLELSSGRQALEGASVAPGTQETLDSLRDRRRRPLLPREPIPRDILEHQPDNPFELDEHKFLTNLRSSRRGAAAGPSGMTTEHLRLLLDQSRDSHNLFVMAERMARAEAPPPVNDAIRLGRLTALQKPRGGVRGIVAGDILRRLVSRTMSQQLSKAVEAATALFQYAMTTRAGTECIAHALQSLMEVGPLCILISIDGIGAFDLISRAAMLGALRDIAFRKAVLRPTIAVFVGRRTGTVHHVDQGEGGEQGDASALQAVQRRLVEGERLFVFLDDVYVTTPSPDRVGPIYRVLNAELHRHARIRINAGKTQVWNSGGIRPDFCDVLEKLAQQVDPGARVWR